MSDLFGNPEDRFSRVEAHINSVNFDLMNRNKITYCIFKKIYLSLSVRK